MSNYSKAVDFAVKDGYTTGNPLKIVKGAELDNEFSLIQTAIATKSDLASPAFTGTVTANNLTVNGTFTATVDGGTY